MALAASGKRQPRRERWGVLAERSPLSAWNARAAVVRCSGARVFLPRGHVKASLTAAIVARSLWAAERSS